VKILKVNRARSSPSSRDDKKRTPADATAATTLAEPEVIAKGKKLRKVKEGAEAAPAGAKAAAPGAKRTSSKRRRQLQNSARAPAKKEEKK